MSLNYKKEKKKNHTNASLGEIGILKRFKRKGRKMNPLSY